MDQVQSDFSRFLREKNIDISPRQLERFELYYSILTEWNEKMNLTAITERKQVYIKHFYDSISLSFFLPMKTVTNVADIGSGAGFPGIPLKILFPHLQLTVIDALKKRISFLHHLVEQLHLDGVTLLHARAEEAARLPVHRDRYELVTARAVARLNVLNEYCLPFVRPGGWFVAMKGTDPQEEIREAEYSLKQLKGTTRRICSLFLPEEGSERHLVFIEKTGTTPKRYPRKPGIPGKEPLGSTQHR